MQYAQISKRDGGEGIDGHRDEHHCNIFRVVGIACCRSNGVDEQQYGDDGEQ